MATTLKTDHLPTIVEGLTAILLSPVILPVASAVKQPIVQNTIKEGIHLSERVRDALTDAAEEVQKITADVSRERQDESRYRNSETATHYVSNGKSEAAKDFLNVMSDINKDVGRMTNGVADLRLLFPTALGFLAFRQLLRQGPRLDDIPWYILAWFAFDAFVRLNQENESKSSNLPSDILPATLQEQQRGNSSNTYPYQRES
jgi:hypothetical protein